MYVPFGTWRDELHEELHSCDLVPASEMAKRAGFQVCFSLFGPNFSLLYATSAHTKT